MQKNSIITEFMKIYGIGKSSANKMCKNIRVSPRRYSKFINIVKKMKAFSYINKIKKIDFNLKDEELQIFVHLYTIRHLKSLKHKFFLPINGQRNATNGATAKKNAVKLRPLIYKKLKQLAKRKKKFNEKKAR